MLINTRLANRKTATEFGEISFNSKGESTDLTKEQEKKFKNVVGYSIKEDKPKEEPKKEEPKKEEPKKEEPKKEAPKKEAPKKEAPKKTTKKAPSKK